MAAVCVLLSYAAFGLVEFVCPWQHITESNDKEQFLKVMAQSWQIHCGQMVMFTVHFVVLSGIIKNICCRFSAWPYIVASITATLSK